MSFEYQHGLSEQHRDALYDVSGRAAKARKVLAVLGDHLEWTGANAGQLALLEVGCSAGSMTSVFAREFERVVGVDIDVDAVVNASRRTASSGAEFVIGDSLHLAFADESFDLAACTHVYEHVPDAQRLMDEVYRVLKPGGVCYFAAGNRLVLIEGHYRLPLLSVVPKRLAHRYLRALGRGDHYYETHFTHGQLRKLVSAFEVIDYTQRVVDDPARFEATDVLTPGSWRHAVARQLVRRAYWLTPTYQWVLRKPDSAAQSGSTLPRSTGSAAA